MSSYLQGDIENAEKYMLMAYEGQPATTTYAIGLATLYIQQRRFKEAKRFVDHLIEIDPNHPTHVALQKQLK